MDWVDLIVDGVKYRANFVKVAVNVVTLPDSDRNVLPRDPAGLVRGKCRAARDTVPSCCRIW